MRIKNVSLIFSLSLFRHNEDQKGIIRKLQNLQMFIYVSPYSYIQQASALYYSETESQGDCFYLLEVLFTDLHFLRLLRGVGCLLQYPLKFK